MEKQAGSRCGQSQVSEQLEEVETEKRVLQYIHHLYTGPLLFCEGLLCLNSTERQQK